jgi:hypothetical protein
VRLTTSHCKTLLLWNLNGGGQGPIWAVEPLDGWMDGFKIMKTHGRYQDTILGMTHSSVARVAYSSHTAEASYQFKRDPVTHTAQYLSLKTSYPFHFM